MKVLVPYGDDVANVLRDIIEPNAEVIQSERNAKDMLKAAPDAIAVASGRVPSEYIRENRSLRMIQSFGAGLEKIDLEAVRERGDVIVCNSHVNAKEVAEYTVMLLLAVSKNIVMCDRELRKGNWKYGWGGPKPNIEVRNKTCLIVGFGNVGTEVASLLRCFNMKITAVTRSGKSRYPDFVDEVKAPDEMKLLVEEADYVILSLPLTTESIGLVDGEFISWMKPSAVLVNVSRAEIVKEAALYAALADAQIAGAALDVWWDYPPNWGGAGVLPSEKHPFHKLDNVVISPHRAAYSENIMQNQIRFVGENILRLIRGETPHNIIDLDLGY